MAATTTVRTAATLPPRISSKTLSWSERVTERGKPVPKNFDEGNVHPVCGQMEATDALATEARAKVCGINEMIEAAERTHRRVGHKDSVSRFHLLKMSNCNKICNALLEDTYRPVKGEKLEVFTPKYRIVTSAKYCDRVPQSSFITNYFYPVVIPHLSPTNCACIKGKGVDFARDKFKQILRETDVGDYCAKADMKSYFASIQHERLYNEIYEYITDDWAQHFFEMTIENASNPVGLDLGSEVYQLSATSFLNRLDHILDNGRYLRYQDDLVLVGNKSECLAALQTIRTEAERLGLTVSEKKTYIQPITRPIKFLGYSWLKHPDGHVTVKRLKERLREERRRLKRMKNKGVPLERVKEHYQCVRAGLKKGTRSDLHKMDKYFNDLFGGEDNGSDTKGSQGTGASAQEIGCEYC